MRRKDREVTDFETILEIIDRCRIIRIGLADGDVPYLVPLNFGYTVTDGRIDFYVHGAAAGRKYELMKRNGVCSFEMDIPLGTEILANGRDVTERYRSVMGTARIEFLKGEEKRLAMDTILRRNEPTRGIVCGGAMLDRCAVARLSVTELSAKANLPS